MLPFLVESKPTKRKRAGEKAPRGRTGRPIEFDSLEEATAVIGIPFVEFNAPSEVDVARAMRLAAFGVPLRAFDAVLLRAFAYLFWESLWQFAYVLRTDRRCQKLGRRLREELVARVPHLDTQPIELLSELLPMGIFIATEGFKFWPHGTPGGAENATRTERVSKRVRWLQFIFPALCTFMVETGCAPYRFTWRDPQEWGWRLSESPTQIPIPRHDYRIIFGAIARADEKRIRKNGDHEWLDHSCTEPLTDYSSEGFGEVFSPSTLPSSEKAGGESR